MNGNPPSAVAERVQEVASAPRRAIKDAPQRPAPSWVYGFIILLLVSQLILVFLDQLSFLVGASGSLRVLARTVPFAGSLALLFVLPRTRHRYPPARAAVIVLMIVAVSVFNPTTNNWVAGTAHAALYLAILAPVFWVPRLSIDMASFRRIALILWGFHSISAALGIAQVYFPGFFQTSLSSIYASQGEGFLESLEIETTTGERVFKPMGLTDTPGGAATSGLYAVLFGMGFLLTSRRNVLRVAGAGAIGLGMMVMYLAQIRSILIVTVLCVLVFAVMLAVRGYLAKLSLLMAVAVTAIVVTFGLAVAVGGEGVRSRWNTLFEDRASEVYYTNRGTFLEHTVDELLPRYPLGAGLGRHGMMNRYFGDDSDPDRSAIWVEIQWTGWLVDGGVPLILGYTLVLLLALWTQWNFARRSAFGRAANLDIWGSLMLAYIVGVLAITFNSPFFFSQSAMEFWVLNAALFTAANNASSQSRTSAAAPI